MTKTRLRIDTAELYSVLREGSLRGPMGASVLTVGGVLSDPYRLTLPYYQRAYAWQKEHVEQLYALLLKALRGDLGLSWYPLGFIILARGEETGAWLLTDGHQRLITLTILLATLRDIETDPASKARLQKHISDEQGRFRLTTSWAAQNCLQHYVQNAGATERPAEPHENAADSELNVIANRDWLRKQVLALPLHERRALGAFILDRCMLAVVTVEEEAAARLLFSTMHDMGLKPTPADLLKATVLGAIGEDDREACQTVWETNEARLGRDGLERLLKMVCLTRGREPIQGGVEPTLAKLFDLYNPDHASAFVERQLRPLGAHLTTIQAKIQPGGEADEGVSRRLQYLEWVRGHDTWRAPLLHWLEKRGWDSGGTPAFVRRLEALAWMLAVSGEDPTRRDARYIALLEEIDAGTELGTGRALSISAQEWQAVRRSLTVGTYTNRKYKLFLMLRLNGAVEGDEFVTRCPDGTIEHILPKRPRVDSVWRRDFPDRVAAALRNSFGNLTLLTEAEQIKTRNNDWREKRPVLAESAFALSRELAAVGEWKPATIERRSKDMVDRLLRSWGWSGQ